ncbi:phospholipase A and acyltransferase 2 [Anolis carolinensis]|uniref:LRAT domain-containing protein n=1 Tax=Anolis carolinensis TaxID=28377 RepID=H9G6H5_ANOCA|nr:PREDICTED: HRAS-like suppressor 2 [Anolis carolinensis]|eukprot:XP_003229407.1 PREDICTED: HRAS-like suppressor 2 [Anolis carolinensis]
MSEGYCMDRRTGHWVVPKPGDLIEISRLGYQHWAVYVGSGYVIHLASSGDFVKASTNSLLSVMTEKAMVKKELLTDIVRGDDYCVNNKYDDRCRPLPANKIVQEAEELLGEEMHYSVTSNNCEHFVTRLRYGTARSDQVRDAVIAGTVGLVGVGAMVVLAGVIGSLLSPRNQEKK